MPKKTLKTGLVTFLLVTGLLLVAYQVFTNFYPSFGGYIGKKQKSSYSQSPQFSNGKFNNTEDIPKEFSFLETVKMGYHFLTTRVPNARPKDDLRVKKIDSANVVNYTGNARMFWFGHSSFLLQMDGTNILLDPMFGEVPSPHPLLGSSRFNKEMPIGVSKLPLIDAVIFSHDHYDHLDYPTILALKDKVCHYFVPLGVGVHLEFWGIPSHKITELDWWQTAELSDLTLVCTPAQHFSGRKFSNGQSTLWSSWVVKARNESIYFSGDSGYGNHFKEIGKKHGPFDLALMECGQYNKMWADIHMMPEETAQAGLDLKAKQIMPIHWAGFNLALHGWKEPINRVKAKALALNLRVITPQIGEEIIIGDSINTYKTWWKNL